MNTIDIQDNLLAWYRENHRSLPFRQDNDPYRIWVSEVMLQQTQVKTMIPYYQRFMEEYPTVFDLALATEDQVYKLWAGLGYYSRAKNLLSCAKEIVALHEGKFPVDYKEALKLPGVGPYTAGAVLSIAYNLKHPAVDGNVMRVISRLYHIRNDIALAKNKKVFEEKVASILPDDVRHFNQALMELGALICTPTNPKCNDCPLQGQCQAKKLDLQDQLPVKTKAVRNKTSHMGVAVLKNQDRILLIKREKGLLSGLWGLPIIEGKNKAQAKQNLFEEIEEGYKFHVENYKSVGQVNHIFTHRTWKMQVYEIHVSWEADTFCKETQGAYDQVDTLWLKQDELDNYAISTAFQKVLDKTML